MISRQNAAAPLLGQLQDFDRAFDKAYVLAAFAMNRHMIDHMLRIARNLTLDDYEAMIIWGVVAHQSIAHMLPPGSVPSAVLNDNGRLDLKEEGLRPLRLRDVVQITRMPRETVRRKLDKLAAQQWIERTTQGWVISGARSDPTLRDFTRESVRRFLMAADEVMRALRATEAVPDRQDSRLPAQAAAA